MRGVQFIVDESGKKRAAVIDLAEWGELWEDFYDVMLSRERRGEPTVSWEEMEAELAQSDSSSA